MGKKTVIIVIALAVLLVLVKVGYDKATDYLAYKIITEIAKENLSVLHKAQQNTVIPSDDGTPNGTDEVPAEVESQDHDGNDVKEEIKIQTPITPDIPPDFLIKLSADDKSYAMSIYKRFGVSEVAEVTGIMASGLTSEGRARIKQIVFSKITREEYNKLLELYKKYN